MITSRLMSQTSNAPFRRTLAATVLAGGLIAFSPATAADDEPVQAERVAVGQEVPGFSLTGTDGESYTPGDLEGEKNLVLIFFRGTWCPHCRKQLGELQSRFGELQELGAELWVIAPDKPEKLAAMREERGLEFPVLEDPDCEVCRAYGILNEKSGTIPHRTYPHPTAVVVDKEGVVRFVRVDVDYKVRPAPEEIFDVLRALP